MFHLPLLRESEKLLGILGIVLLLYLLVRIPVPIRGRLKNAIKEFRHAARKCFNDDAP